MKQPRHKHTPGPWSSRPCSNGGRILFRGESHIQSHLQVFPEADARIMAAAPRMFEALERISGIDIEAMDGEVNPLQVCVEIADNALKEIENA